MQYKLYKVYTQLSLGRCLKKTQSESSKTQVMVNINQAAELLDY